MPVPEGFLLRDPAILPTPSVLHAALKRRYGVLDTLVNTLAPALDLTAEWRYYRDGGGWLCKLQHRRKTVAWLSVWSSGVKLTFYFNPRTAPAVFDLPITEATKAAFRSAPPIGQLRPLTLTLTRQTQLTEARTLLATKARLK